MQIADLLSADRVVCNLNLSSKKAALETLAGLLASAASGLSEEEIFNSLLHRERLGDTGLGNGIALPHGRLRSGHNAVAAFIRLRHGVDYDAQDRQPVDLMFALLVPEKSTEEHLQVLAKLAEMFDQPALLQRLRQEESAEAIYRVLTDD